MVAPGYYTPRDAAALLHERPERVRRWAFGYRRSHGGERVAYPPLLLRAELLEVHGDPALTFVELVELMYVQGFVRAGAPWRLVREAARTAARLYGTDHPFARRDFLADPGGIYAVLREADGGESLVHLAGHGQLAFASIVRPYLHHLDFGDDQLAIRWWPMGRDAGIVCDPWRQGGRPILHETRVSVDALCGMYDGERRTHPECAVERVAWLYEIRPDQVEAALRFREWLEAA